MTLRDAVAYKIGFLDTDDEPWFEPYTYLTLEEAVKAADKRSSTFRHFQVFKLVPVARIAA